ncbi:DUF4157 domain-containing protein [Flavobacterium piscis]|uniref:eCIS core domain-containing protein n=1 Tax=Flavobacterium piscis TaxID=1114874 RepID=A0ABU1YA42_9FLAO|nr:DUF4157 domain-containing protein [Flavobacterium piscis]MDR7211102.1 hypothetical protein [Flavobacterium piscis]
MEHHNKINKNKQPSLTPKTVQTKGIYLQDNRPTTIVQKKTNNTGLPDNLKSGIENLSGHSMDDVKVHYNSDKPAQLNAHAYAQGSEIHLASGQEKHLPHEAWHVVQQKQGRVKPTLQMKGKVNINDDAGLEKEADMMGERAIQMMVYQNVKQLRHVTLSKNSFTLQGKWILRNGHPVEVADNYDLQQDETDFDMSLYFQQPRVIFNEGNKIGKYDKTGNLTFEDFDSSKIPTHDKLQETRKDQGIELGKRLLSSSNIKAEADKVEALADKLEKLAGSNVPKKHDAKIKKMAKQSFTGDNFRKIIKAQDEFTQSEATAALFDGLRNSLGSSQDKDVQRFIEQTLRAYSSLRARTGSISAPMNYKGNLVGQQHPTSWTKHDKLPSGGSSHSYSDRQRVHIQNQAFSNLSKNSDVSASMLIISNLLSALVATLSTMASAHSAENVPDFDLGSKLETFKDRSQVKLQTETVAEEFGFNGSKRKKRKLNAKYTSHDYPSSPIRDDNASSDDEDLSLIPIPKPTKNIKLDSNNSSSSIHLDKSKPMTPSISELLKSFKITQQKTNLQNLILRIQAALPVGPITSQVWLDLNVITQNIALINGSGVFDSYYLTIYYNQIVDAYTRGAQWINRQMIGGNPQQMIQFINVTRINALEQFMAECGQMAVHNVVALQTAQENGTLAQVNQGIQDTNALHQIGNFNQNIGEGDIRTLLANAGHQGIPVIGNLAQLQTFIRDYNTYEALGQTAFNMAGWGTNVIQHLWPIGNIEAQEIVAMNNFTQGVTNEINFIINTDGHQQIAQGDHWITVRLERTHTRNIRLFFLDSLRGDRDYSMLFAALNRFISNQQV